jgi:hypothetical protein
LPALPGTRFAVANRASTGFAKEDDVNWKKPFGWNGFARLGSIMRRPAAIAIVVIGVLAAAILYATHQPSARGGASQATARRETKQTTRTATSASARESRSRPTAAKSTPVTITGCLERDDQTFRLKDTAGAGAPRSRSWKTAFLKKNSASVEVIDAANRLKMNNYVGQRVRLTGTLVDRELHARALKRVAPSCAARKSAKSAAS